MNKSINLIAIIGPDGTGKTTQVNLLIDYFKSKGIECKSEWLRFHHFFSLPLLGFARIIGLSEIKIFIDGDTIGYHYFKKSKLISSTYPYFMLMDTLFFYFFRIYLPIKIQNNVIVCDRFVYDTLIDIALSVGDLQNFNKPYYKLFLKLIPKNSIIFVLIAKESEIISRRSDLYKDSFLMEKIFLYNEIAKRFNLRLVNASENILVIHEKLIASLNRM